MSDNPLKRRTPSVTKAETSTAKQVAEKIHGRVGEIHRTSVELRKDLFRKMKVRLAYIDKTQKDYLEELIVADLKANGMLE